MKFTKEAQDVIDDLFKQIDNLQEQVYGAARGVRQFIIQDLIRLGKSADQAIIEAEKLCAFIEGIAPVAKKTKAVKAVATKKPKAGKRKYTKRSKFWAKKK